MEGGCQRPLNCELLCIMRTRLPVYTFPTLRPKIIKPTTPAKPTPLINVGASDFQNLKRAHLLWLKQIPTLLKLLRVSQVEIRSSRIKSVVSGKNYVD